MILKDLVLKLFPPNTIAYIEQKQIEFQKVKFKTFKPMSESDCIDL